MLVVPRDPVTYFDRNLQVKLRFPCCRYLLLCACVSPGCVSISSSRLELDATAYSVCWVGFFSVRLGSKRTLLSRFFVQDSGKSAPFRSVYRTEQICFCLYACAENSTTTRRVALECKSTIYWSRKRIHTGFCYVEHLIVTQTFSVRRIDDQKTNIFLDS